MVLALLLVGCGGKGGNDLTGASRGGGKGGMGIPFTPFRVPGAGSSAPPNMDEVRSQVMSLSDSYCQTVIQSLDELVNKTKDPAKATWGRQQRVATLSVSMVNATGPNPVVGLLDMVVFSTLKRQAVEEHWVPKLLGDEGQPVAAAHRRGEEEAWAVAKRVLTPQQLDQLRDLILQWRQEHPGQYYVGQTRFSDFDAYRNLSPESPQAKTPGSLFSLFYVDPLAGLDPMAREIKSYRTLTERMVFMVSRLPVLASYQVDLAAISATGTPEVRAFVASTEKFAEATTQFANAASGYPKALGTEREALVKQLAEATARERQAAIEQAAKSVAAERETIFKQIDAQDGRIRAILAQVKDVVARAEQAGTTVNASTSQTVASTEQSTHRILDHAFRLALVFVAVVVLGVPLVLLIYRAINRRILDGAMEPRLAEKS